MQYQCAVIHPGCDFTTDSLKGIKSHFSKTHGGWVDDDILKVTSIATAQEGAGVVGSAGFQEGSLGAPASDAPPPEDEPRPRKVRKAREPEKPILTPEQNRIRTRLAHFFARILWLTLAVLLGDKRLDLTPEEEGPLTDAWCEFLDLIEWVPTSKKWAPIIVAEAEYEVGLRRWPILSQKFSPKPKSKANPDLQPGPESPSSVTQ